MTTPNHRKIGKRLLLFLAAAATAQAVGTVRQSTDQIGNAGVYMVSLYWTGDSVNGTVPVTLVQSQNIPVVQGYRVVNVETTPGSPAPTNGYSLTLLDAAGVDVLAGAASGLSSSSAAGFAGSATSPPIYGSLSLSITGQSVAGAKGTVFVYLAPFSQVIGLAPTTPNFPSQGADLVFASPCNSTGSPGFRALCAQDLTLAGLLAANNAWTANNTYTGGTIDLHGSTKTLPNRSGTGSPNGRDNCATVGETYFQTDAIAGLNLWGCTTVGSPGVWTVAGTPLPAGTQTQVLRLQPNTGNNTTLQFASLPSVVAGDFFFPAQTPGGSLSIGTNTITMTPCPLGVNGADVGHSYYIQGGTGTAEAVAGTGGSCTSGASTGTLTFTAAHTHTGAWTIQTATGGIQEAQQFLSGVGGTIYINVGVTLHAAVNAIVATPIRFVGISNLNGTTPVIRGSDYPNGDLFSSNLGGTIYGWSFENMQIKGNIGSAVTGADIHITNNNLNVINTLLGDSQYGIECNGCSGYVNGLSYVQSDYTFTPTAGILLGQGTGPTEDMMLTNLFITGTSLGNANSMNSGIQVQGTDTIVISNGQISASKVGLLIDGTVAANANVNDVFSGLSIIDNVNYGIQANGNADACNNLLFSGINITGDNNILSTLGQFYGINWGAGSTSCASGIEFNGGSVTTFANHGILVFAPMSVQNFNIFNNNTSNSAGQSGISVKAGQTGIVLTGNNIYNTGSVGHQAFGIVTNGALTGTIVGNDLSGNATSPIGVNGQLNGLIANNKGISDVIGTVADAATIVFPINPDFTITGSGTGITAVTMTSVPAGQTGILRTTAGALTFTAGGGIGNTCTTTQNVPVPWIWDGTSVWLKC